MTKLSNVRQSSEAHVGENDIFIRLFVENFDAEGHLTSVSY